MKSSFPFIKMLLRTAQNSGMTDISTEFHSREVNNIFAEVYKQIVLRFYLELQLV